eukprot:7870023-Ditylum_brightwellii.AAC.1
MEHLGLLGQQHVFEQREWFHSRQKSHREGAGCDQGRGNHGTGGCGHGDWSIQVVTVPREEQRSGGDDSASGITEDQSKSLSTHGRC